MAISDSSRCSDSDGGVFSSQLGVVSIQQKDGDFIYTDGCSSASELTEYSCPTYSFRRIPNALVISCELGCRAGACVSAPEMQSVSEQPCALQIDLLSPSSSLLDEESSYSLSGTLTASGVCSGTYTVQTSAERYTEDGQPIADTYVIHSVPKKTNDPLSVSFTIKGFKTPRTAERAGGHVCGLVTVSDEQNGAQITSSYELGILANNDPKKGGQECVLQEHTYVEGGLLLEPLPAGETCKGEKKNAEGFVVESFEGDAYLYRSPCQMFHNGKCDAGYIPGSCSECVEEASPSFCEVTDAIDSLYSTGLDGSSDAAPSFVSSEVSSPAKSFATGAVITGMVGAELPDTSFVNNWWIKQSDVNRLLSCPNVDQVLHSPSLNAFDIDITALQQSQKTAASEMIGVDAKIADLKNELRLEQPKFFREVYLSEVGITASTERFYEGNYLNSDVSLSIRTYPKFRKDLTSALSSGSSSLPSQVVSDSRDEFKSWIDNIEKNIQSSQGKIAEITEELADMPSFGPDSPSPGAVELRRDLDIYQSRLKESMLNFETVKNHADDFENRILSPLKPEL